MQKVIPFILASVFIFSGFHAFGSEDVFKIEITHSHSHEESAESSNEDHQHSHEFVICCSHPVFIEAKSNPILGFEIVNVFPAAQDMLPPSDRSLASIFRPPILS